MWDRHVAGGARGDELVELRVELRGRDVERTEALGGSGKAFLLTSYASNGESERPIGDPFGGELALYRDTYVELERELNRLFDRLAAERASERS